MKDRLKTAVMAMEGFLYDEKIKALEKEDKELETIRRNYIKMFIDDEKAIIDKLTVTTNNEEYKITFTVKKRRADNI